MGDIKLPGIPDVACATTNGDRQLKELLIAMKTTLEKLTGADPKSNSALIDLLNDNQP